MRCHEVIDGVKKSTFNSLHHKKKKLLEYDHSPHCDIFIKANAKNFHIINLPLGLKSHSKVTNIFTLPPSQILSHFPSPTLPAMGEKEQARPLAPAVDRPSSDDEEATLYLKAIRRRKFAKYCGCLTAFVLALTLVIIILSFTVFKIKEPVIKMNGITITTFQLGNNNNNNFPINAAAANMSLTADVSVKNPNAASFKYSNTTTTLYYNSTVIGEARGPPGQAKARRTIRLNVTVDIMADQIMSSPSLLADVGSGLLNVSSYSRVPGRVKILNIIKRHVVLKMNCTFTVNILSRSIQEQKCKRKVKL